MNQESNMHVGKEPSVIKSVSDTDDVKKLNKNPILIISAVVIVLVLALLYVAGTRSAPAKIEGGQETVVGNGESSNANYINQLAERNSNVGSPEDYNNSNNGLPAPMNMNNDPLSDPFAQQNSQNGTVPPLAQNGQNNQNGQNQPPNPFEEFRKQQAMKRLKAGFDAMETPSKMGLTTLSPSQQNGTTPQNAQTQQANAMSGYIDKIMGMGGMANGAGSVAGLASTGGAGGDLAGGVYDNTKNNKSFLGEAPSYDYLASKKTAQLNPFEVKTGTVIPAILITGVNSELPGKMKAQISENVYDTATGKYLLIPQGSTLVGDYSSGVVYGQKRVLTAWNRIIFPDGKTLNIGNMGGTDREGFSGFQDEVDNHYMRIFGSAFMMGAITGGIAYSAPTNNTGNTVQTPSDQMIASMITQLGQVGIQMIQKNMNVAPTLTIRAGYKFNVFVTKDMRLEPLKMKLR